MIFLNDSFDIIHPISMFQKISFWSGRAFFRGIICIFNMDVKNIIFIDRDRESDIIVTSRIFPAGVEAVVQQVSEDHT